MVGVKEGWGVMVATSVAVGLEVGGRVVWVGSAGGMKFSAMGGGASSRWQLVAPISISRMRRR
jgi:hypothetical protein